MCCHVTQELGLIYKPVWLLLSSAQKVSDHVCVCVCVQSQPASLPAVDISTNSNGPKQDLLFDDDAEDLFPGMNVSQKGHTSVVWIPACTVRKNWDDLLSLEKLPWVSLVLWCFTADVLLVSDLICRYLGLSFSCLYVFGHILQILSIDSSLDICSLRPFLLSDSKR